jgi:hypothetical protein
VFNVSTGICFMVDAGSAMFDAPSCFNRQRLFSIVAQRTRWRPHAPENIVSMITVGDKATA